MALPATARDLRKLLRKEPITPVGTGPAFRLAPLLLVGTTLVVAALMPLISTETPMRPSADLILVVACTTPPRLASPASLLAAIALAVVILAETGRLPVDNLSTHLELTMIHEAMILEYAGPDLALIELGPRHHARRILPCAQ